MLNPMMPTWCYCGPRRLRIQGGFTLIELLITISIIAVLAGMLIPTVGLVKTMAYGSRCSSQQRQIFMATQSYCTDQEGLLPNNDNHASYGGWSWLLRVGTYLYPEIGEASIRNIVYKTKSVMACPAALQAHADKADPNNVSGYASYAQNTYVDSGLLPTFAQIKLPAEVMLNIDAGWASSSNYWNGSAVYNNSGQVPESPHRGSTVVTYADGHVEKSTRASLPLTDISSSAGKRWWKGQ